MYKIIIPDSRLFSPFNEPARDLRILNNPLWLHQRNVLAPYATREKELEPKEDLPNDRVEMIVYRNNLFFDEGYIKAFISAARNKKRAVRAAFSSDDPAFRDHALPLSTSYTVAGDLYLADLWYYPNGPVADVEPLIINYEVYEMGYYHVPTYMADQSGLARAVIVVLLDGTYELFRAHFGQPSARGRDGTEVGAARGLLRQLHALLRRGGVTHAAVTMRCENCHVNVHPGGDTEKKGTYVAKGKDLCLTCHDASKFSGAAVVHQPVRDGLCVTCHDPHGSNAAALLRPDMPNLCITCHNRSSFLDRKVLGPVSIGDCTACHAPHLSKNRKLLKKEVPSLCFDCHRSSEFIGKTIHSPVKEGSSSSAISSSVMCRMSTVVQNAANILLSIVYSSTSMFRHLGDCTCVLPTDV